MAGATRNNLLLWISNEIDNLILNNRTLNLLNEFNKSYRELYKCIGYPSPSANEVIPDDMARLVSGKNIINYVKMLNAHFPMITCGTSDKYKDKLRFTFKKVLTSVKSEKLYKMTALRLNTIHLASQEDLVLSLAHIAFKTKDNQIFSDDINFTI